MSDNLQLYNLVAAFVVFGLDLLVFIRRRDLSRHLVGIVLIVVAVNVIAAIGTYLTPEYIELVRFINAALRSVAIILLLGLLIHRPRHEW